MDWTNRVALVTGASSGIGLAVARDFAARGVRVALVARTRDKLSALARELGEGRAASFPVDVTDRPALQELPRRVKERFGRLDVVVNNAGVNHRGPVHQRSAEELAGILETNLVAPVLLTRAALDVIEPDGVIVNVASLAGKVPMPDGATYSASKFGLRAFSHALSMELALHEKSVRVAAVSPGPVATNFFGDEIDAVPDIVFSQPMSTADDVARAVVAVIERGLTELDVPVLSGKLSTAAYLSPRLYGLLRPLLQRVGAKNKARFVARSGEPTST